MASFLPQFHLAFASHAHLFDANRRVFVDVRVSGTPVATGVPGGAQAVVASGPGHRVAFVDCPVSSLSLASYAPGNSCPCIRPPQEGRASGTFLKADIPSLDPLASAPKHSPPLPA